MKVKLTEWASRNYSPAPSIHILRRWTREGQIHPEPEKAGRDYYVEETAIRIVPGKPRVSLVDRLKAA